MNPPPESTSPLDGSPPPSRVARPAEALPLVSDTLLKGRKSVEISHNGEIYRLQATRLGKLILTK